MGTSIHLTAGYLPLLYRYYYVSQGADPNKIKPDIVVSYPTFLEELINYDLNIKPSFIVTISENLTSIIREKLENKFLMAKVIETYGCTECPFLAVSCSKNNLHLQEDIVFVEPIDKYNKKLPLEIGKISDKILITNLIEWMPTLITWNMMFTIFIKGKTTHANGLHKNHHKNLKEEMMTLLMTRAIVPFYTCHLCFLHAFSHLRSYGLYFSLIYFCCYVFILVIMFMLYAL